MILLQFAIKTFDLVVALTGGGPGIATTFPAIYVYDLMFQRGQIGEGAAAAIMMLLALAVVLVPYALFVVWRRRREAGAWLTPPSPWPRSRGRRRAAPPRDLAQSPSTACSPSSPSSTSCRCSSWCSTRSASLPEIAAATA